MLGKYLATELISSVFFFFWDRISLNYSGWPWASDPPTSVFWVAGISGPYRRVPFRLFWILTMTTGNALHTVKTVGAKYILVPSLLGANNPLKLSFAQCLSSRQPSSRQLSLRQMIARIKQEDRTGNEADSLGDTADFLCSYMAQRSQGRFTRQKQLCETQWWGKQVGTETSARNSCLLCSSVSKIDNWAVAHSSNVWKWFTA